MIGVTKQLLAEISLTGIVLDGVGGLYLAYDLLGGKRGPLRVLTRAVTYSVLFGFGYRFAFSLLFGIVAGIGLGTSVALESAVMTTELTNPLLRSCFFASLRGAAVGIAGGLTFGRSFGELFGLFTFIGLFTLYSTKIAPLKLYSAIGKPKLTFASFGLSLSRAATLGIAAFLSGILLNNRASAIRFGIVVGFDVALTLLFVTTVSPFIEWWADNLSERKLGAFGVFMIVIGFLFQTIQYLAIILKVPIR